MEGYDRHREPGTPEQWNMGDHMTTTWREGHWIEMGIPNQTTFGWITRQVQKLTGSKGVYATTRHWL